jgi:hypothetical protein
MCRQADFAHTLQTVLQSFDRNTAEPAVTTSVRLLPEVEESLASYCAQAGVSKSHVLQEALAEYLAKPERRVQRAGGRSAQAVGSPVFQSFQVAALIGRGKTSPGAHAPGSADKATVRAVARARLQAVR